MEERRHEIEMCDDDAQRAYDGVWAWAWENGEQNDWGDPAPPSSNKLKKLPQRANRCTSDVPAPAARSSRLSLSHAAMIPPEEMEPGSRKERRRHFRAASLSRAIRSGRHWGANFPPFHCAHATIGRLALARASSSGGPLENSGKSRASSASCWLVVRKTTFMIASIS